MRLLAFTLSAIAAGVGIQFALVHLPYSVDHVLGKFTLVLMFVLPMIVTGGLACAMRVPNIIYVYFAIIFSPFVAAVLGIFFLGGCSERAVLRLR
jgi:hypothetical protein